MKKSLRISAYRILAAAFLGAGGFLLVAVWLHVINPALALHDEPHTFTWYLVGTFLAVFLLTVAWCLNLKAVKLHANPA